MTPKIIELKQAPVVLVELPFKTRITLTVHNVTEECTGIRFRTDEYRYVKALPFHIVKKIGYLSDLTEVHFETIIPELKTPIMGFNAFPNFYKGGYFKKASDSFYSLLESEKVYTENPFGIERPPNTPIDSIPYTENKGYDHFRNHHPNVPPNDPSLSYESFILKWQEAQTRTIDPKRTVVLLRKEEEKFKGIKEEVIKETAIKSWEDDAKYNPIPNNPYAYCNGFKAGCKEVIEHPERYGLTNKAPEMMDFINRISAEMLRSDFVLSEKWYDQAQELIKKSTEL